ncbi:hypothetical protein Taro_015021, partial [Colocasia esculenta]|nr:hypothetical protein [Colocasia esculenta]
MAFCGGSDLLFQSVVAPAHVVSRPHGVSRVQGGFACQPSTLWRPKVAVLVVRRRFTWLLGGLGGCAEGCFRLVPNSVVPVALAGEGLVIPTRPCSRGSLPLLPSARGSSSRELSVGRFAETAVAPRVVNSSESECCELLYLMHISLDYFFEPFRVFRSVGGDANFGVPGGGPRGCVLVAVCGPVALRLLTRRGGPSRSGCRGLKAQAGYPFPLSLLFFPFPSSPAVERLPSGDRSAVVPEGSWRHRGTCLERGGGGQL